MFIKLNGEINKTFSSKLLLLFNIPNIKIFSNFYNILILKKHLLMCKKK